MVQCARATPEQVRRGEEGLKGREKEREKWGGEEGGERGEGEGRDSLVPRTSGLGTSLGREERGRRRKERKEGRRGVLEERGRKRSWIRMMNPILFICNNELHKHSAHLFLFLFCVKT